MNPDKVEALLKELKTASGVNRHFDQHVQKLESFLAKPAAELEPYIRQIMTMIALAIQGNQLLRHSTTDIAEAFCASRLGNEWGHEFGTLQMEDPSLNRIVDRAMISC